MTRLVVITRAAGVLGALAVSLAATGCVTTGEFKKTTDEIRASIETAREEAASEAVSNRESIDKALAELNVTKKQIAAINARLIELKKLDALAKRVQDVEAVLSKMSPQLEQIRKIVSDANVKVVAMDKRIAGLATIESVNTLRTDTRLKVTALENKDAELAKTSTEKNADQDVKIKRLSTICEEVIRELKNVKTFVNKLDGEMKDHKAWTLAAVGEQDKTIVAHSQSLRKTFQASVKALDEQLKKMKEIAGSIRIHQAASAPAGGV